MLQVAHEGCSHMLRNTEVPMKQGRALWRLRTYCGDLSTTLFRHSILITGGRSVSSWVFVWLCLVCTTKWASLLSLIIDVLSLLIAHPCPAPENKKLSKPRPRLLAPHSQVSQAWLDNSSELSFAWDRTGELERVENKVLFPSASCGTILRGQKCGNRGERIYISVLVEKHTLAFHWRC